MRCPIVGLFLTVGLLLLGTVSSGENDQEGAPETLDCGTIALYQFLQIEHRPITWEAVHSRLGRPPRAGHSMLELRDAAQGFGIDLIGVKLAMTHRSLDRPGIVFVKRGSAGHFLIARPVGTSGKLIQLLDGVQPPEIMDVAELEMLPGWTGLALLPERTNWIKVVAATLTLGSSSIVVVWLVVAARRRKVKQQPP